MDKTFSQRVIDATLSIPSGRVATYGDISRVCGGSGQAARSVLGILPRAARSGIDGIPWHRIVYSGGKSLVKWWIYLPENEALQKRGNRGK